MDNYILFIVLILLILTSFCYLNMHSDIESFTTYSYSPFDYITTGSDPMTFYQYPVYKNPYRYPYRYYSSYPYPYLTHYPNSL